LKKKRALETEESIVQMGANRKGKLRGRESRQQKERKKEINQTKDNDSALPRTFTGRPNKDLVGGA